MLRFLLRANRGYWLRPARNPYLRWRIETYSGIGAESITPAAFWRFISANRRDLVRFLRWTHRMAARTGESWFATIRDKLRGVPP